MNVANCQAVRMKGKDTMKAIVAISSLAVLFTCHALCAQQPPPRSASGRLAAQETPRPASGSWETASSAGELPPVSTGFLIYNGEYVPPPYSLEQQGENLLINGRTIAPQWWIRAKRSQVRIPSGTQAAAVLGRRVAQQLQENAAIIVVEDKVAGVVGKGTVFTMLDVLLSADPDHERQSRLSQQRIAWLSETDWQTIFTRFKPTDELRQRVGPELERYRQTLSEDEAKHRSVIENQWRHWPAVRYAGTVAAMLLSVIAVGNLLTHRPPTKARWRELDTQGDGVSMLAWNVALVFLFGIVDLGLTLLAQQAGGMLELNPLGNKLSGTPLLLVLLKVASLVTACSILLALRRYRGAQVASWWLCLLGAMLMFRWLTYNSLFLS